MKEFIRISMLAISLMLILCLANASEYAFGTKVRPQDSDIGLPIFNMPATTDIRYWDTGPNSGIYDSQDLVYLDVPPIGVVNANDIRLTAFGDYVAGSKVKPGNYDMNMPLTPLPAGPAAIRFLDVYGSTSPPTYDLEDPVYIHRNGAPPVFNSMILANDVRLTAVNGLDPGTKISNLDIDQGKLFGSPAIATILQIFPLAAISRIKFYDSNGNSIYDYPDDVYMEWPIPQPVMGMVAVNSLRLSGPV